MLLCLSLEYETINVGIILPYLRLVVLLCLSLEYGSSLMVFVLLLLPKIGDDADA